MVQDKEGLIRKNWSGISSVLLMVTLVIVLYPFFVKSQDNPPWNAGHLDRKYYTIECFPAVGYMYNDHVELTGIENLNQLLVAYSKEIEFVSDPGVAMNPSSKNLVCVTITWRSLPSTPLYKAQPARQP